MYIFFLSFSVVSLMTLNFRYSVLGGGGGTKIRDTEKGVSCPSQSAYWVLSGADGFL